MDFYHDSRSMYSLQEAAEAIGASQQTILKSADDRRAVESTGTIGRADLEAVALWCVWSQHDVDRALEILNLPEDHPLAFRRLVPITVHVPRLYALQFCERYRTEEKRDAAVTADLAGAFMGEEKIAIDNAIDAANPGYRKAVAYPYPPADQDPELKATRDHDAAADEARDRRIRAIASFYSDPAEWYTLSEVARVLGVPGAELLDGIDDVGFDYDDNARKLGKLERWQVECLGYFRYWPMRLIEAAIATLGLPDDHPLVYRSRLVTISIPEALAAIGNTVAAETQRDPASVFADTMTHGFSATIDRVAESPAAEACRALEKVYGA